MFAPRTGVGLVLVSHNQAMMEALTDDVVRSKRPASSRDLK